MAKAVYSSNFWQHIEAKTKWPTFSRHFIYKFSSIKEVWISIAFHCVMAWRLSGGQPLSEPMMAYFTNAYICATWSQWVEEDNNIDTKSCNTDMTGDECHSLTCCDCICSPHTGSVMRRWYEMSWSSVLQLSPKYTSSIKHIGGLVHDCNNSSALVMSYCSLALSDRYIAAPLHKRQGTSIRRPVVQTFVQANSE